MKRSRKFEERLFRAFMYASVAVLLGSVVGIIVVVCLRGIPALSWQMLTKTSQGGFYLGKGGGILNAIAGSLYLSVGAVLIAFAVSCLVVAYLNAYASPRSPFAAALRFLLDVLSGVPSIVYGAFGFTIMLALRLRASLIGGIITVALLVFPIMARSMDEVLMNVPGHLLDATYSLGATRFEAVWKVMLRQAVPGIVTAVLLSFGRAIGDAASVIFTAGFSDYLPTSLAQPVATLPLAIFFQLGTPVEAVRMKAYASAVVLTAIVLAISTLSRVLSGRMSRSIIT